MSWGIRRNKIFPELVDFGNCQIRKILDLQYLSIVLTEKKILSGLSSGTVLDFGSGSRDLEKRIQFKSYFSLDPFMPAHWSRMTDVPEGQNFDLIAVTEVLEHVANPSEVLEFFSQHQQKGQKVYITTPFLAREHGAPNDFCRWTEEGMRTLLNTAGYSIDKIIKRGDFLCVVSSYLNYALFHLLLSPWFILGLALAPIVLLILLLAQILLRWGVVKSGEFYLGLSVLATKM